MKNKTQNEGLNHDIFISYSRTDKGFASRLQKALEAYKPPKDLNAPQRHLVVFRDEDDFTGVDYHKSIERHLRNSAQMIVICSPHAHKSKYVNDEIRLFAKIRGRDYIIPVILSGIPNNEARQGQEDDVAFPESLVEIMDMPLAASYLGFDINRDKVSKGVYYGPWYTILANIYNLSRGEIEQRDKKRQYRRHLLAAGIVSAVIITLTAALIYSLIMRNRAENERQRAYLQRQVAIEQAVRARDQARLALAGEWMAKDPTRAALVLLELEQPKKATLAINRLHEVTQQTLSSTIVRLPEKGWEAVLSPKGNRILAINDNFRVLQINASGRFVPLVSEEPMNYAAFNAGGDRILTSSSSGIVNVWEADHIGQPIFLTQEENLYRAILSPVGERVATISADEKVRVWKVGQTSQPIVFKHELLPHEDAVNYMVFSPDGSRIVTAHLEHYRAFRIPLRQEEQIESFAWVWRSDYQGPPIVLQGHVGRLRDIAFSPDGKRIVTASNDGTARVWDVNGNHRPIVLRGHQGFVEGAVFSADSSRVLTWANDSTVRVWMADGTGESILFEGHEGFIESAVFNKQGNRVATASSDKTARIWTIDSPENPIILEHQSKVMRIAFSPDGAHVITSQEHGPPQVWEASHGIKEFVLRGHTGKVSSEVFSPDSTRVVTVSSEDRTARFWHLDRHDDPWFNIKKPSRDKTTVVKASFMPDDTAIIIRSNDGKVHKWHLDGSMVTVARGVHTVSPNGSRFLTISNNDTIQISNSNGSNPVVLMRITPDSRLSKAVFSPDSRRVALILSDHSILLWSSGQPIRRLLGHENIVTDVAFSPDGSLIATTSLDGTSRIWTTDSSGWAIIHKHESEMERLKVEQVVFSPDSTTIVTVSNDGIARTWNTDKSANATSIGSNVNPHRSIAFSPDGQAILTICSDGAARIWIADGSGKRVEFAWGGIEVTNAAFSPDGTRIAMGLDDETVRLGNADGSGVPVVFQGHHSPIRDIAFDHSGNWILATEEGGTVRLWSASEARFQKKIRNATSVCLDPSFRQQSFGEDRHKANKRYEDCEVSHGR